jgi:cobalamin biosynthesis protein CobW
MRLVIQAVGNRFEQFYDRPWRTDEPRETKLVFIGQSIDRDTIESNLLELAKSKI